jgi:hypothetical protein
MRTKATRVGRIATAFMAAIFATATAVPAASAQAADTQARQGVTVRADITSGKAIWSAGGAGIKGWIKLHRPDGEVVHVRIDQIVFVMTAAGTGANERAQSRLQLANGFSDVRESVEEVMQAIQNDYSLANYGT